MRKEGIVCFLVALVGVVMFYNVSAESKTFGINVTIAESDLYLNITHPVNVTYFCNMTVPIIIDSNADYVWYNLDGGSNDTYPGNLIIVGMSMGAHELFAWGNNSVGQVVSDNVTFNVSEHVVIYDEFRGVNRGASTDFDSYNCAQLQNLDGIILENNNSGGILFHDSVDVMNDANPFDGVTNIDEFVNVSSNRIELNSSGLPNFNQSAMISIYELAFSNPRILRDGEVCSGLVCTFLDYVSGNLSFNSDHFTVYSAEETPVPPEPPGGGGGGGGGGGSGRREKFIVSPMVMNVSLGQGEIKRGWLTINNTGNTVLYFDLKDDMGNMVGIGETKFTLEKGENKTVLVEFVALPSTLPDLYTGKIIVDGREMVKEVLIYIEVDSEGALFDVRVAIPEPYLLVYPGNRLIADVYLFNVEYVGLADVIVDYFMKDFDGEVFYLGRDSMAVDDELSYVKKFAIPRDANIANYVLFATVTYDNKIGLGSSNFEILGRFPWWLILIVLLVLMFVIWVEYMRRRYGRLWRFRKLLEASKLSWSTERKSWWNLRWLWPWD